MLIGQELNCVLQDDEGSSRQKKKNMKRLLLLITIPCFVACTNSKIKKLEEAFILEKEKEKEVVENVAISQSYTFIDNDTFNNIYFNSISKFDPLKRKLNWEIKIYENDELTKVINDSLYAMSYLVKALDANGDGMGELIFVTGKSFAGFRDTQTLKCFINAYVKYENDWIKIESPELTEDQKKGYHGNELINIEDNLIVRKYPLYDHLEKPTGKDRIIKYKMSDEFEWLIEEDKIF